MILPIGILVAVTAIVASACSVTPAQPDDGTPAQADLDTERTPVWSGVVYHATPGCTSGLTNQVSFRHTLDHSSRWVQKDLLCWEFGDASILGGSHQGIGFSRYKTTQEYEVVEEPLVLPSSTGGTLVVDPNRCVRRIYTVGDPREDVERGYNQLYNHGSTVTYGSYLPDNSADTPVEKCWAELHRSFSQAHQMDADKLADIFGAAVVTENADRIKAAVAAIPDGPCDAFCGSCKYCLPPVVAGNPPPGTFACHAAGGTAGTNNAAGGHNSNSDAWMAHTLWTYAVNCGRLPRLSCTEATDAAACQAEATQWRGVCNSVCGNGATGGNMAMSGPPGVLPMPEGGTPTGKDSNGRVMCPRVVGPRNCGVCDSNRCSNKPSSQQPTCSGMNGPSSCVCGLG